MKMVIENRDASEILQAIKENIQTANSDPKLGQTEAGTVVLLRVV